MPIQDDPLGLGFTDGASRFALDQLRYFTIPSVRVTGLVIRGSGLNPLLTVALEPTRTSAEGAMFT